MAKKEMKKKELEKKVQDEKIVRTVGARGRTFEGTVTRKFPKRIAIEFERTIFIPKFERFAKKKTRIHARLPDRLADEIQVGDYIQVRECRPLSKIIHFVVVKKLSSQAEEKQK